MRDRRVEADRSTVPIPRKGLVQRVARRVLAFAGWRVDIAWPPEPKCVIIVYPHTSNWDFVVGYVARLACDLPVQWMGKDELFRWPVASLWRRMGGIPVDRRRHGGLIQEMATEFAQRPWLWLAITPEGTRAHVDHWKSGFYRLALVADVPVGLAFLDYRERVVGLRTYVRMTGEEEPDLARIRGAYAGVVGKRPALAGDIRLTRSEEHTP